MKLTDAEIRAMKRFASSMADHIPPCPWNPFPRDSEWGRKIEAYWQRDQRAAAQHGGRPGMPRVWCVRANDGLWCAAAVNDRPDEAALNVKTRCGHSIVLPHGVSERVPTCPDCRAAGAAEIDLSRLQRSKGVR